MGKNKIELDKLASELFTDITRADMSLSIQPNVMARIFPHKEVWRPYNGFYAHLVDATAAHSFMIVARLFDEPTSRFSVTLESLVRRINQAASTRPHILKTGEDYLARIYAQRAKLAKVRNSVFAHRVAYPGPLPKVQWAELEDARDLAKEILQWYGSEHGHAYSFRVPGFQADCRRFVELQFSLAHATKSSV
jgi:hypothetical protein